MVMMRVKTTIMMRMMRMMIRMMSGYDNDEDVGCFPRSMIAGLPQHNLRDGSVHVNNSCTHLNQRPWAPYLFGRSHCAAEKWRNG